MKIFKICLFCIFWIIFDFRSLNRKNNGIVDCISSTLKFLVVGKFTIHLNLFPLSICDYEKTIPHIMADSPILRKQQQEISKEYKIVK